METPTTDLKQLLNEEHNLKLLAKYYPYTPTTCTT